MAIVTLNRALQMASQINSKLPQHAVSLIGRHKVKRHKGNADIMNTSRIVPSDLSGASRTPMLFRCLIMYDFIEDRVVVYGSHELNIDDEATQLLIETRSYLMMIAKVLS